MQRAAHSLGSSMTQLHLYHTRLSTINTVGHYESSAAEALEEEDRVQVLSQDLSDTSL